MLEPPDLLACLAFYGKTKQKLYFPPSLQSSLPKPCLISHFSWKIFAQSGASDNAWIKRSNTCPVWYIVSPRAVFSMFSFTEGTRPCGVNFNENDKSNIDLNAFDLWGIAAIGETFIFVGKSPLRFL